MQSKALAALFLLLAPALAMPQANSVASSESSGSDSSGFESSGSSESPGSSDTTDTVSVPSIPTDFVSVLETAVPTAWEYEMMNSASMAAVVSAAAEGIYPTWYNDLPASIKAIVTSLGGFDEVMVGETGSMTVAMSTSSSGPSSEPTVATTAVSSSGSVITETQASATSSMASSSKSSAPASASSTGGAPMATGAITMGVAGAAGLLGLALCL
ncbi:hypothetical protein N7494_003236 [Penicillium frequentans]|uniref:Uncharacterized protein n=1 Tax=Penicillium frequentans TaxID=3151616 RepID=A0AAD6D0I7_9EURO|nr:hypothetical protein N7494_003236 [Penicillium glabrum]